MFSSFMKMIIYTHTEFLYRDTIQAHTISKTLYVLQYLHNVIVPVRRN